MGSDPIDTTAQAPAVGDTVGDTPLDRDEIEARLVALEQASDERRAALRRELEHLPAALSRRGVVLDLARDLRAAPDKGQIVSRAARKLARAPRAVVRRATHR